MVLYLNNNIKGRKIAIWGLAFKPQTDDMREALSFVLINALLNVSSEVAVYDPIAIPKRSDTLATGLGMQKIYTKRLMMLKHF